MDEGKAFQPIHPGEILFEEFLQPLGISQRQLAKYMKVAPGRINAIVRGKRRVTADIALRLSRALGTTPNFWMNLQAYYDLEIANDAAGAIIEAEVTPIPREDLKEGDGAAL